MITHVCMVCFDDSANHENHECWPPRCCHGCGCGEERPASDVPDHDPAVCPSGICIDQRHAKVTA